MVFLYAHRSAEGSVDLPLLYSIETMVIQWTQQIWEVLQKDSSQILLRGDNAGPDAEINFWVTQRDDLLGIQKQVRAITGF